MKNLGFGTVKFEGKEYALTQQPYIDGPADGTPECEKGVKLNE